MLNSVSTWESSNKPVSHRSLFLLSAVVQLIFSSRLILTQLFSYCCLFMCLSEVTLYTGLHNNTVFDQQSFLKKFPEVFFLTTCFFFNFLALTASVTVHSCPHGFTWYLYHFEQKNRRNWDLSMDWRLSPHLFTWRVNEPIESCIYLHNWGRGWVEWRVGGMTQLHRLCVDLWNVISFWPHMCL